jgi:hypothetical protein
MDGGEVASGTECVVISCARLMPDKSLARVLASSVRLGLARCWEATPVVVSGARTTPDMSPAGVLASSARSGPTAHEVSPLAWPRLLRLFLLRRGGWRGKPGCSSSTAGRCRRRFRLRWASRRPSLLSCCVLACQLSAFWTRKDPRPTSEFDAACSYPDGLMQDGTQGGG